MWVIYHAKQLKKHDDLPLFLILYHRKQNPVCFWLFVGQLYQFKLYTMTCLVHSKVKWHTHLTLGAPLLPPRAWKQRILTLFNTGMRLVCFMLADGGDVCSGSITLPSRGAGGWGGASADKKIYRSPDTCNPSQFCLANASHTPAWAHLGYQRIKQQEAGSPCFIYDSSKALKIGRFTKVIKIADLWLLGVCAGPGLIYVDVWFFP